MQWITRENIKVDRVACPWLITRFVDPFLFVPEAELVATAEREGATPFDAPRLPAVRLNHRGDRCMFEAILEDFTLVDPTLHSQDNFRLTFFRRYERLDTPFPITREITPPSVRPIPFIDTGCLPRVRTDVGWP
jgi:ChrB, C-terminal domain